MLEFIIIEKNQSKKVISREMISPASWQSPTTEIANKVFFVGLEAEHIDFCELASELFATGNVCEN